jgi:hypothetical protein
MSDELDRNRDESKSNNWVWYLVLTTGLLFVVAAYVVNSNIYRMKYPDLVQLLKETEYQQRGLLEGATPSKPGRITITTTDGGVIELSKINNLLVHDNYIDGRVFRRKLDSKSGNVEPVEVRFRANKEKSEESAKQLGMLLDSSNVVWEYSQRDTWFDK